MLKHLFIGGSKDGERLVVHEGNRCEFLIEESYDLNDGPTYKKESYRKETYLCEGKPFDLFIIEGMGNSTAFNMILNGYRQLKT